MEKHSIKRNVSKRLGEILIELKIINEEQLNKALTIQKDSAEKIYIGEALTELGFASEEEILQAVTIQYSFPYLPLDNYNIDKDVIRIIPLEIVRKYLLVPLCRIGNTLSIAMSNPLNTQALTEVEAVFQSNVQIFITTPSEIRRAIYKYYNDINEFPERRKYKRIKIDVHIALILNNDIKDKIKLKDISEKGFCALTESPLAIDEQLEFIMLYPFFKDPVKIKAKIVWCEKNYENLWEIGADFGRNNNKIDLSDYIEANSNNHHKRF